MRRTRRVTAVIAALLIVGATGCGSGSEDASSVEPTAVIVDTDGGSDDAMALLYLLQRPEVEVAAITVSGTGLVHCPIGASNVAGLVELASPDHSVPIACGPAEPIEGDRVFPDDWRTQADGRYGGILPAGDAPVGAIDAVDLLTRTIDNSPRPLTILTLGPLTNLALALEADPGIEAEIDRVVVMGGAFSVPGNVHLDGKPSAAIAEWNVYVDPAALQRVLGSGVPVTFVSLDTQVPVDPYVVRAIERSASTPPADVVAQLLTSSPFFVSGEFFFWDPLAASAVAQPSLFTTKSSQVSVVTDGVGTGWTTVGGGSVAQIATVVDGDEFIGAYVATLDGRPAPIAISREPDAVISAGKGCTVAPSTVSSGASVVLLEPPTAAAAVGTIETGRSDAEIDAFLATSPDGPPPWFTLSALLQPEGGPGARLVHLVPGDFTVVCIDVGVDEASVTGRAPLNVDVG